MKVFWSERARADLKAIIRTIAEEKGGVVAQKWRNKLDAAAMQAGDFPYIGSEVRELGRKDIREVGIPPYRIIYRILRRTCVVYAVLHSRQSLSHDDLQP